MHDHILSFNTRKALCLQLGDSAGRELAEALDRLSMRLDALDRDKVSVTPIVPIRELTAGPRAFSRAA